MAEDATAIPWTETSRYDVSDLPYKTLLSLFDYSGQWSAPFADAGWMVVQVDIKHGHDIKKFNAKWLIQNLLQSYPTIDGILAAPPCTCFTKSAAQYWPAMDADGRTAESVELVYQVLRCVDYLKPDFLQRRLPDIRLQAWERT